MHSRPATALLALSELLVVAKIIAHFYKVSKCIDKQKKCQKINFMQPFSSVTYSIALYVTTEAVYCMYLYRVTHLKLVVFNPIHIY